MHPQQASMMRRVVVLAAAVLAVSACATLQVGSDYDHGVDFAGYHSFALMQREHHGASNPLVAQRAEDDIKADLASRGFAYVDSPANADFIVDFTIGSKDRTNIASYPEPYVGGGWWGWGPGAWWGAPYWGSHVDVQQYKEGTLSIDVFDAHTHRPVWHGWAKKPLTQSDIAHPEGPIREAVDQVLAKFPPMRG